MKWFFAIVFPPIALLLCGKPIQAILNFVLCLFGWLPGVIHAMLVVMDSRREDATSINLRVS